jgi:hypothetical protein
MATGHVQRPPSAYNGPRRSSSRSTSISSTTTDGVGKDKTINEDDDDLPPRMSTDSESGEAKPGGTSTPSKTGPGPEGTPGSGAETPITIPKTAGFDFAAIKDLLDKELDSTDGKARDVLFEMPRTPTSGGSSAGAAAGANVGPSDTVVGTGAGGIIIPPPTNRTESMPTGLPTVSTTNAAESGMHTPRSRTPSSRMNGLGVVSEMDDSSGSDLARGLGRSLSLQDAPPLKKPTSSSSLRDSGLPSPDLPRTPTSASGPPPPPEKDLYTGSPPSAATSSSVYQLPSFSSSSFSSPAPMSEPALSFGGADGSIWGSSSSRKDSGYPLPSGSVLGGLGRTSASPFNASTSSLAYNPFASPGPSSSGLDSGGGSGLSFGGVDGSITTSFGDSSVDSFGGSFSNGSAGISRSDPWAIPSDLGTGKKKSTQGLNTNPWS